MSPEPPTADSAKIQLQGGLHQRHLTMIALGGVIGAGLFVGSGAVINQTGPAAVLSYILTGVLIVLVMRMRRDGVGQSDRGLVHRAHPPLARRRRGVRQRSARPLTADRSSSRRRRAPSFLTTPSTALSCATSASTA